MCVSVGVKCRGEMLWCVVSVVRCGARGMCGCVMDMLEVSCFGICGARGFLGVTPGAPMRRV